MEKIKIKGNTIKIPSLSELTFRQFNDVIVKGNALQLNEYLAVFLDMPVDEIMRANIKCASLPVLHQKLFNLDISAVQKDLKSTVKYKDNVYPMSELSIDTFGASYFFELMRLKENEGKINQYELCLYALALGLSKKPDYSDTEDIFKDLYGYNWTAVISQSFFLGKLTSETRIKKLVLSVSCILGLKAIKWQMVYYLRNLKKSERK